jgi:hypothetical protein
MVTKLPPPFPTPGQSFTGPPGDVSSFLNTVPQAHANDKPALPMTKADYYQLIRGRIENENELINQRLIWMVFSQSFMFSAFVMLANAPEKAKNPVMSSQQDLLMWIIPGIALFSSGLIYVGLIASMVSAKGFRHLYDEYPTDDTVSFHPPLQNVHWIRWFSVLPPIILPVLFMGTWLFIMLNQIIQSGRQP